MHISPPVFLNKSIFPVMKQHMIQWTLPCDNIVKIVRSLYHNYTVENIIENCDSMIPTLRQRREIVESLYHDDSAENRKNNAYV